MGQGNAVFYARPSARSASVLGAGSVVLMFLGPPNNSMERTRDSSEFASGLMYYRSRKRAAHLEHVRQQSNAT